LNKEGHIDLQFSNDYFQKFQMLPLRHSLSKPPRSKHNKLVGKWASAKLVNIMHGVLFGLVRVLTRSDLSHSRIFVIALTHVFVGELCGPCTASVAIIDGAR
jgi:hypothetical protein